MKISDIEVIKKLNKKANSALKRIKNGNKIKPKKEG